MFKGVIDLTGDDDSKELLKCPICLEILKNPYQCKNGHMFCLDCIKKALDENQQCPTCKCALKVGLLSKSTAIQSIIDKCVVYCSHAGMKLNGFPHGCGWSGMHRDLQAHLATECQLEIVDCPLKDNHMCSTLCKGHVRRCDLDDHLLQNISGQNLRHILSELKDTKQKLDSLNPVVEGLAILRLDGGDNIYCGEMRDGVRHGHGLLKCQDKSGDYYCGSWVNDKEDGFGEEQGQCERDTCLYRGEYQAGNQCGKGTMTWGNGDKYTGEWLDNHQHGMGFFSYKNGDSYHGLFRENLRHGQGQFRQACGDIYEGNFSGDKMHGTGTYKYADGTVYEGQFEASHYHGQGVLRLPNGQVYTGAFQKGRYHGEGRITQFDGLVYEGTFSSDKYHGRGELHCSDGKVFRGQFVRGLEEGPGEIVSAHRGVWKKGNLMK